MSQDRTNFDRILKIFDRLYFKFGLDYRLDSSERPLYLLLYEFRDKMPQLETLEDYNYFHKAFRQIDVMDTGEMDMVFWHLLDSTELFWCACEEVLNNKNAEEMFLDHYARTVRK